MFCGDFCSLVLSIFSFLKDFDLAPQPLSNLYHLEVSPLQNDSTETSSEEPVSSLVVYGLLLRLSQTCVTSRICRQAF